MTAVLVTGAAGFIGRRVVRRLREGGYDVRPLTRSGHGDGGIQHDLRFPLANIPPVDWIIHLAGAYAGAGDNDLERADLTMARNIVRWGRQVGVENWILASAAEVYGDVEGVASEETPTRPVIPYGRIKLRVEELLAAELQHIAHRIVICRIGEVYGSGGRLAVELTARLSRGFCPWPGSGNVPVSFVHVEDVANAFLCGMQGAPTGVSLYNVADDVPTTWREFLEHFAARCGTRRPVFLPIHLVQLYAVGSMCASWLARREPILTRHAVRLITTPKRLSSARLKRDLRFEPQYRHYLEGLEETVPRVPHHA